MQPPPEAACRPRRTAAAAAKLRSEQSLAHRHLRGSHPLRPLHSPSFPPVLLFLSDLHLGRGAPAETRAAEHDAVALLDAHADELREAANRSQDEDLAGLVLLGDVFNAWIEYRTLVPKGGVRLLGALAALTDAGVPVTYVVGNRDPWQLSYLEEELGVRLVREAWTGRAAGRALYIAHGDGRVPSERAYNLLRPILRSGMAYRLFRTALPGDWGFRLAQRVAARDTGDARRPVVEGVRAHARHVLATTAASLAVMGHSHQAELTALPGGTYLNPGYWFADRTFARLDIADPARGADGVRLLRWADGRAETVATEPAPAGPEATIPESSTDPAALPSNIAAPDAVSRRDA